MDLTAAPRAAKAGILGRLGKVPVGQVHHWVTAAIPLLFTWLMFQSNGGGWPGVGVGLAQTFALLGARRAPIVSLLLVGAIDLGAGQFGAGLMGVGPVIAMYYTAAWGSPRPRRLAPVIAAGYAGTVAIAASWLPGAVIIGLWMGAFWISGRFEASQRGQISELHERSSRLVEERAAAEERAAERERALLARELHDILNHSVTRMVLDAEAGAETVADRVASDTLRRVADTGRDSLAELRRLLGVLRTTSPDELRPPPGLSQVDELIARIPAGGPRVVLERRGSVRAADTSIELAGYRVVQESLTNVAKHAGAVPTTVRLIYLPDTLEIEVTNELPARPTSDTPGTGLIGLRERVELLGGTLHAGPAGTEPGPPHAGRAARVTEARTSGADSTRSRPARTEGRIPGTVVARTTRAEGGLPGADGAGDPTARIPGGTPGAGGHRNGGRGDGGRGDEDGGRGNGQRGVAEFSVYVTLPLRQAARGEG